MAEPPKSGREAGLTFSQMQGLSPLPTQMRPGEINAELRAKLWAAVYTEVGACVSNPSLMGEELLEPWDTILCDYHVDVQHLMLDDFSTSWPERRLDLRELFAEGSFWQIFDFLQFCLYHSDCERSFEVEIARALGNSRAAYRIEDHTIIPVATEEEAQAVSRAFDDLTRLGFDGARRHLRDAAQALTAGRWAPSIRESISAVESVARKLTGEPSLSAALQRLQGTSGIHPALREGLNRIYGYTSDEQGLRHPLIDEGAAAVDGTDAQFMFGACAAFVSYLLGRAAAL